MKKDVLIFIEHILDSIKNIENFMRDVTNSGFIKNKEKQSAVIREIEVIGEAVKNISPSFKSKHLNIPWKDIAGMRDKLMHHYFGVNLQTVWKVVKEDLPKLKTEISKILEDLKGSNKLKKNNHRISIKRG